MRQELPVPEPDPGDVADRAGDILSRAEFRQGQSLLDRLSGWLDDALNEVFGNLSQGGVGGLIGWLILGTLLAGVVWFVSRMGPLGGLASHAGARAVVEVTGPAATDHRTAEQWRTEAARLVGLGRYDEALRARYRALLADLIDQGLIADVPGRTPGEYRTELAEAAPPAANSFAELTTLFESIWYGANEAAPADLQNFERNEDVVLDGVTS